MIILEIQELVQIHGSSETIMVIFILAVMAAQAVLPTLDALVMYGNL
jgi:hypothetical protein